jgi:dynactin-5
VTIKDCCYVMPDSVVTQDTVIPAFSIVGGNPARIVGELPPTNVELMKEATTTFYDLYLPLTTATKQRQMLALMQ